MKMKQLLIMSVILLISILDLKSQSLGPLNKTLDYSFGNDINTEIIYSEIRDNEMLFIGNINSSGLNVSNHYGGWDIFMFKTDLQGNLLSETTFGGSANDILHDVVKDTSGNYHLFNVSNSPISGTKTVEFASGNTTTVKHEEIYYLKVYILLHT